MLSSRVNSRDIIPSPPVLWAGGEGGEEGVHTPLSSRDLVAGPTLLDSYQGY